MNKFLLGIGVTILSGIVLKIAYDMGQNAAIEKIYARGWHVVDPSAKDENKEESSTKKEES